MFHISHAYPAAIPPAKAIFAAFAAILAVCAFPTSYVYPCDSQVCQTAKGVIRSHDPLVDFLESIKDCLDRLDIYGKISPTRAMTEIIVDALDEWSNTSSMPSPREKMLMLVKELLESQLPNLWICVTSRPEADIKSDFDPLTFRSISLGDKWRDTEKFIKSLVNSNLMMRRWKAEDELLVIDALTQKANGMQGINI